MRRLNQSFDPGEIKIRRVLIGGAGTIENDLQIVSPFGKTRSHKGFSDLGRSNVGIAPTLASRNSVACPPGEVAAKPAVRTSATSILAATVLRMVDSA